jgi:hypothetical protein
MLRPAKLVERQQHLWRSAAAFDGLRLAPCVPEEPLGSAAVGDIRWRSRGCPTMRGRRLYVWVVALLVASAIVVLLWVLVRGSP